LDSEEIKSMYPDPSFDAPDPEPEHAPEEFGPQPKIGPDGRIIPTMEAQEAYVAEQMQQAVPEGPGTGVPEEAQPDQEFVKAMQRAEAQEFAKTMGLVPMAVPKRTMTQRPVVQRNPNPPPQQVQGQAPTMRRPNPAPNGHYAPVAVPPPQAPVVKEELENDPRSLTDQLIDYAREKGDVAAAKEFGTNAQTVRAWFKSEKKPLSTHLEYFIQLKSIAVNQHVKRDLTDGSYSIGASRPKLDVMFCCPVSGQITPAVQFGWLYLAKTYGLKVEIQAETMLVRARNMLTDRFLESGAAWMLTVDKDIMFGIANERYMRDWGQSRSLPSDLLGQDALVRLLSHGQPFVGALYSGRGFGAPLVIAADMAPRSQADRELADQIRAGQHRNHLLDVDWLAAGFLLVHRSVFETIRQHFPDLKPEAQNAPWNYWTPVKSEGEDVALSMRAKACGFVPKLDCGCVVGHVGQMVFWPEHTGQSVPMRTLR
jgi:hypothetical protein